MRAFQRLSGFFCLSFAGLTSLGCVATTSYVETNATLGRVVVYRNGIAYFERTAEVTGGELELAVPSDKVDDFLKSLTVLDAETKQPTPISYPTTPMADSSGIINMKILLKQPGTLDDPRKLLLSYVTEAPSWKPSYRIVLGDDKKVDLEAWAIVDNTSGEDWNNVQLGVGSSSALSFRFDLHSVRNVARETLAPTDLFAQAPPTGMSVYGGVNNGVVDVVADTELAEFKDGNRGPDVGASTPTDESPKKKPKVATARTEAIPVTISTGSEDDRRGDVSGKGRDYKEGKQLSAGEYRVQNIAQRVKNDAGNRYVVEGFASQQDEDKPSAALERANKLREQLIAKGVRPDQIDAVANTTVFGATGGARVITAQAANSPNNNNQESQDGQTSDASDLEPIGTSHFESKSPMTVKRGMSAMVSILHSSTDGEVVYYYDPESERGSKTHAFKAVRLKNPTDSTLETGPVTVFGEDGFIGEGLTEPIPGKSSSFVPFALDRQVLVETTMEETDGIARILTAQRGVLSTEMRHVRKQKLVVHNRLDEEAIVFVRHTVPKNYTLSKHPDGMERIGEAHLFRVVVPAGGKTEVEVEEVTPVFKTVDIRSSVGMELVKAYVSSAALEGDAAAKLRSLVELQKELGNVEQKIDTQREQMDEYRQRMDELHAQIVTLKAVKTGGSLMKNLEAKLGEVSDKLSSATVTLVALEEQRMISRIKLQDGVAELSLDKSGAGKVAADK